MVRRLRNECHSHHYLTWHIYCNGNWLKWLYSHSDDKRNAKYYPTKYKYYRFNKLKLYDN